MVACAALGMSACGSSGTNSANPTNTQSKATPINVGLMVPLTGKAASSFAGGKTGVKAAVDWTNDHGGVNGHKINLIVADTKSSATGALSAAQLLVQRDQVVGIIQVSDFTSGAARYLLQNHIPLLGPGGTGPQWATPKFTNLFPSYGSFNTKYEAPTTFGKFFKAQGVTKFATVGCSLLACKGSVHEANTSVKHAGIPVVYSNTSVPIGTTNFGAIALALKSSGANGLFLGMTANMNIALITDLRQDNANVPVILGTGYGSTTLSSPPSVQAMQGVYILNWAETQSDKTKATKIEQEALSKYVNFTLPPGSHVEQGYFSALEFIQGLKADKKLTSAGFISAMRHATTNATGLFGNHPLNFSKYGNVAQGTGPGNCLWITKLVGTEFKVVSGADPVCGTLIPGTGMSGGTS